MRNDAKLGMMPAALDRIYRILQNFSWVVGSFSNHGKDGKHGSGAALEFRMVNELGLILHF